MALISEVYGVDYIKNQNDYKQIVNDIVKNKNKTFDNPEPDRFKSQVQSYEQTNDNYFNLNSEDELIRKIEQKIIKKEQKNETQKNGKNKQMKENFTDLDSDCEDIIRHCLKCKNCRKKLIEAFKINNEQNKTDELLDIVIYALTGVFVLFLLDFFIKIGKIVK
jgi:hypothetical protein